MSTRYTSPHDTLPVSTFGKTLRWPRPPKCSGHNSPRTNSRKSRNPPPSRAVTCSAWGAKQFSFPKTVQDATAAYLQTHPTALQRVVFDDLTDFTKRICGPGDKTEGRGAETNQLPASLSFSNKSVPVYDATGAKRRAAEILSGSIQSLSAGNLWNGRNCKSISDSRPASTFGRNHAAVMPKLAVPSGPGDYHHDTGLAHNVQQKLSYSRPPTREKNADSSTTLRKHVFLLPSGLQGFDSVHPRSPDVLDGELLPSPSEVKHARTKSTTFNASLATSEISRIRQLKL